MEINSPKFTLKDWSIEERPREKLISNGPQELTNSELLALLIGSGNNDETSVHLMQRLMASLNNDLSVLHRIGIDELMVWKGIGPAKAVKIKAALELGKRIQELPLSNKVQCTSSAIAFKTLTSVLTYLDEEQLWVLYLNNQNQIIERKCLSKGGISETIVDVRMIFKKALQLGSTGLIIAHNHPSGELKPSPQDHQVTEKVKNAGISLDIELLDHLIISEKGYFSFADEKLL